MWRPQADALRDWHKARNVRDILLKLNTGAGKTLVGLIAAQSIVNQTQGKVLYVCANNQLLEQTQDKAREYGVTTSTYYRGRWTGDAYDRGLGPALTNYQAVFNGKSIFQRENLVGAVFDDAHTAHAIIRDQFTIRVDRERFTSVYDGVIEMTRDHFCDMGRGTIFDEVVVGRDSASVLFVPTFVSSPLADRLVALLREKGVLEVGQAMFAWPHLRGHIKDCAVLLNARGIEITPLLPPVKHLRPFQDDVRRLYLSATLPADDEFCRTFGRYPGKIVEPGGRAGETERMILIAPQESSDDKAVEWGKQLVDERKTLIMVPYGDAANRWVDFATVFRSEDGHARIRQFAESENEKLVFVARYDGVDLPGEDCRILVIYGLPVGATLMERFFRFHLEIGRASDTVIASRLVQMLGRISRGMADYGVVLVLGQQLVRWILAPEHLALLPSHLRRQLKLALVLRDSQEEWPAHELLPKCLGREEEWLELYEEYMRKEGRSAEADTRVGGCIDELSDLRLPAGERRFLELMWDGRHQDAAKAIDRYLTLAFDEDPRLGAWYLHWQAHALLSAGLLGEAESVYRKVGRLCGELGRLPLHEARPLVEEQVAATEQANLMAGLLTRRRRAIIAELREAGQVLADPDASAGQHEEAVRVLGGALAFDASRPDNDGNEGPDVLWVTPSEDRAFILELKTKKEAQAKYNRDDIGQFHQHIQWTAERLPLATQVRIFVGPRRGATRNSNPPDDLWVVAPAELVTLSRVLVALYERALAQALPLFKSSEVQAAIEDHGLAWGKCEGRLELAPLAQL
ncbi:MAG: DEAD/DEAH box helicase family protein [Gemmatimonadetes bacterium]|nr:DEAD/DEAH box helicase family protein [Gemmatimonadota bacterium]